MAMKGISLFFFICIVIILLPYAKVAAQSIKGNIYDKETNSPVQYANVVLLDLDSLVINGTITDSNGHFQFDPVVTSPKYLMASHIGFEPFSQDLSYLEFPVVFDSILLSPLLGYIDKITVTANLPQYSMNGGELSVNIAGSVLSKEVDINEVLRKLPGLTMENQTLKMLGGGSPLIYINGRKIRSTEELQRILPENVKEIKILDNPGAEYEANVDGVILITTKRMSDGLMAISQGQFRYGKDFTNIEALNLSYKEGISEWFLSLTHVDLKKKPEQYFERHITSIDLWDYFQSVNSKIHHRSPGWQIGANFSLSTRTVIGFKYDGNWSKTISPTEEKATMYKNEVLHNDLTIQSRLNQKANQHQINAYINSRSKNSKFDYNVFGDYLFQNNTRRQIVNEIGNNSNNEIALRARSKANIYALEGNIVYKFVNNQAVTLGYNYSSVNDDGLLNELHSQLPSSDYETSENKNSVFSTYRFNSKAGKFSLNVGLRYEFVNYKYTDKITDQNNISKNYNDIFPSFNISYKHTNDLSQSFSYRRNIQRPSLSILNSEVYYSNQYSIQLGNPLIVPQIADNIQYTVMYKNFYLRALYSSYKDYIANYYYATGAEENIMITTWNNYEDYKRLLLSISGKLKFGIYQPNISLSYIQPFLKLSDIENNRVEYNKPTVTFSINNYLNFKNGYLVNLEYQTYSKRNSFISEIKPKHIFNFTASKSFINNTLSVNIYVMNIFDVDMGKYYTVLNNIKFKQREYQDERQFGLAVTYRFNNIQSRYRGQSAAMDEKTRLK